MTRKEIFVSSYCKDRNIEQRLECCSYNIKCVEDLVFTASLCTFFLGCYRVAQDLFESRIANVSSDILMT